MNHKLRRDTILLMISIICAIFASINQSQPLWILAYSLGGFSKAQEGIHLTLKNKSLNVEFLMIFAAISAAWIGYYMEGAILIFIFSISGILEALAMSKAQKTLTALLDLSPKQALLKTSNSVQTILVNDLQIGDMIVVPVGQEIGADGEIVFGSTQVNQSSITGESQDIDKSVGDSVYAGTVNTSGAIHVRVTKHPHDFLISKMVAFIDETSQQKNKLQSNIDKFEKVYVYIVLLMALLLVVISTTLNIWTLETALYRSIVLLVVASPCALVASSAPAMLAAISWGAKQGILIKGSSVIEAIHQIDTIVFDKTGTLTYGKPRVKDVKILSNHPLLFNIVYHAEKQSHHPLASALVEYTKARVTQNLNLDINEIAGKGIETFYDSSRWTIGRFTPTQGTTSMYSVISVTCDDELIAQFYLQDYLREDAKDTVQSLTNQQLQTILLSGDHAESVKALVDNISFTKIKAECLPQDKVKEIDNLQKNNQSVMMVGDGINDAPALMMADVGVAMGQASDISLQSADVVLLDNSLSAINKLFNLTKRTNRIIKQNIIFSMSLLIILVFYNVFLNLPLPFGVFFHEGSTILVILNGLRILSFKLDENKLDN